MEEQSNLLGWVSVLAILLGPITGVVIARYLDDRRENKSRKWKIFSGLMRTRKMGLSPEHVESLNLVEIEFYDNQDVIVAWRNYLNELGTVSNSNESFEAVDQRRSNLLTRLLDEMAKVLKLNITQLEILDGNYIPQGWIDEEQQSSYIRRQLVKVLQGQSVIPISVINNTSNRNLFPAPPDDKSTED